MEVLTAATGNPAWRQRLKTIDQQLDHFLVGPDINHDDVADLFIVTLWSARMDLFVDALSGRDGSLSRGLPDGVMAGVAESGEAAPPPYRRLADVAGRRPRQNEKVTWVRQTGNRAASFRMRRKRNVRRERALEASLSQSWRCLEQLLPATESSPSQAAMADEQQRKLGDVLARLPDAYRQVILCRYLQELPYDEIALRMNRTPGAVRMLWGRALTRLREEMGA